MGRPDRLRDLGSPLTFAIDLDVDEGDVGG